MYTKSDEIKYKQDLKDKIAQLKKEKNAVIIVHNYQRPEIQEIADVAGDSLGLSKAAVEADSDIIVFCGVNFMAESASILNPDKKVLLPVKEAGCPMADMITVDKLRAKRKEFPDAAVVCYVNSSAAVKAESDICCTSSNAVRIVKSLKNYKQVIFVPDKNLGMYVQSQVPEKEIILWDGFCITHVRLHPSQVFDIRKLHPEAKFIAHPECSPDVLEIADHITSTSGMVKYAAESEVKEFIIGTEEGLLYALNKKFPDRKFYLPSENLTCANMKLTTLGWVVYALENEVHEIKVPEDIRIKAKRALDRMLEVSKGGRWSVVTGY